MERRYIGILTCVLIALVCSLGVVFGGRRHAFDNEVPVCSVFFELQVSDQNENHCQIFYIDEKDMLYRELPRSILRGTGAYHFRIPCQALKMLRIDFGSTPGNFRLKQFRCLGKSELLLSQATCKSYNMESCQIEGDSITGSSQNVDPFVEIYPDVPIESCKMMGARSTDLLLWFALFSLFYLVLRAAVLVPMICIRRNLPDVLLVLVFLALIALPMFFFDSKKTSTTEKRMLASFPQLILQDGTLNEQFQQSFSMYLSDHFTCRSQFLELNACIARHLRYPCQVAGKTIGGRNGWFFDHIGSLTMLNFHNALEFAEPLMQETAEQLRFVNDYCVKRGKKFYVLFLPDKYRVYDEFFPSAPKIHPDSESALVLFVQYLRKHVPELKVIHPLEALRAHRNQWPLYFKTDTHWTEMGGFWGGQEFLQVVRQDFPDIPVTGFAQTVDRVCHMGDLYDYSNCQIPADLNTAYPEPLLPHDYQAAEIVPLTSIDNPKLKHSVFFVHDSFIIGMTPLLGNSFGRIRGVRSLYSFNESQLPLMDEADIVVFECLERFLPVFRNGLSQSCKVLQTRGR